ncbi:MAG: alpha/beta hydrolase [Thermoplasmata archaeon]|nr:alpha/beta hydrolase [Thermoplasmata archaeon]
MPFARRDGVRLHYEIEGSGPPVLFHTGAGGDLGIWRDAGYVDGLPEFRKILLDQRGRGASDRPEGYEAHRLEQYVEDVAAVLDDAGVASAGFWGYSNGTMVGVAFGGTYPERLQALVGTGMLPCRNFSEVSYPLSAEERFSEIVAKGGVRVEVEARMNEEGDRFPEAIHRNVLAGDPRMLAFSSVAW